MYIVGAGPGDVELITVKGKRAIEEADIIFYDRLINDELLTYAKENAELVFCGKKPNYVAISQATLNKLLVKHAKRGKVVTRLKGGDPFIFGRGGEEVQYCAAENVSYEIVPGITSGIAAPAYAGIPVTHRHVSRSFTVISGHNPHLLQDKWAFYAHGSETLLIYMGMKHIETIVANLIAHGKCAMTPVAIVQWGTTKKQRTITATLETIVQRVKESRINNPAIIVIGEVVSFHEALRWFENDNEIEKIEQTTKVVTYK